MISEYSNELSNGTREFAKEPTIPSKMWGEAILMQQNSFISFKLKSNDSYPDHISHTVPSSKCSNPNVPFYKELIQKKWKSFDEYIKHGYQQFYLIRVKQTDAWKRESTCTCTSFMKQYICKHIIAVALKEEITECPDESDPTFLSSNKRKAGKSKYAEPALVIG